MNIYVGNLSYQATEEDLQKLFSQYGEVESTKIITDRFSGRSRGFGFVNMNNNNEGQLSIEKLNSTILYNMSISVNEARPREERSDRDNYSRSNSYNDRY